MSTVEYQNISKSFGPTRVLNDISFKIEDHEFVVLLGPSGCGKTTLLRMTAGLETVSGGDLRIGGERVNDVHPRNRNIAMVFQNYALYPTMKVDDNIAFSLMIAKTAQEKIREKVEWAAGVLNLAPYLKRFPKELSGGQRQRVAMGRAMVREAGVFLFDEPLSNLDAKLRAHMRMEIRQLHDKLKTTTIYVTHDQIEAMTMADKIVVMNAGKVEQIGPPEEVYERPNSKYVADFVGSPSMNFVEGKLTGEPSSQCFEFAGMRVTLEQPLPRYHNQSVLGGIRPNELNLEVDDRSPIVVSYAERTGADVNLYVDAQGQELRITVPKEASTPVGSRIRLTVNPKKLHLFDLNTEARIN